MKGIELPINVLVIVAVAVIVLLGIVALFMIGFSPFSTVSGQESYKNAACTQLVRGGCVDSPDIVTVNFDADEDGIVCSTNSNDWCSLDGELINQGTVGNRPSCNSPGKCIGPPVEDPDTLMDLCANFYQASTETACKKVCGCPGY